MLEVLEQINFPTPTSMKRSGDIRMWIYIMSRTSGQCISLILHPSLTAGEAAVLVGGEAGLEQDTLESLVIHEVVMGGCLERPLHHSEKLLDVTLRWGSWEEEDRHDNYLLLKFNRFYSEAVECAQPPLSVAAEVMFSDNCRAKSKFSSLMFSVSNANITSFKVSLCSIEIFSHEIFLSGGQQDRTDLRGVSLASGAADLVSRSRGQEVSSLQPQHNLHP